MDRAFINPHMIYAYIGLWYHDNQKKCDDYMKDYSRTYRKWILQTWFQIQYLYLNMPKDEAQRFEKMQMLKKVGKN